MCEGTNRGEPLPAELDRKEQKEPEIGNPEKLVGCMVYAFNLSTVCSYT